MLFPDLYRVASLVSSFFVHGQYALGYFARISSIVLTLDLSFKEMNSSALNGYSVEGRRKSLIDLLELKTEGISCSGMM